MLVEASKLREKLEGPRVKQFSLFLENKVGALLDVVKLLKERTIDVLAINVQDSADTAIVRIVVTDPEAAHRLFTDKAIAHSLCDLVVAELKEGASEFCKLLTCLLMAEVNIHGSYALLSRPRGYLAIAMHVEDAECASSVLQGHSFRLLSQADLSR
jgi:hypothetical protein